MENESRFRKIMSFSKNVDRAPVVEWASWWDKTIDEWKSQDLPSDLQGNGINEYFGQDRLQQFWIRLREDGCPGPKFHGGPIISNEKDYDNIRKFLFTDKLIYEEEEKIKKFISNPKNEGYAYWYTLEGFFWFPRTMFGIEGHFYSFFDEPELMLQINHDLCEFHKKVIDMIYSYIDPVFMTFAEDMSYNHGSMLSKEQYDRFVLPFYKELTPIMKSNNTKVIIDTDGFVEPLIPWFLEGGVEGILPLERMAGVDVNRIRKNHPDLIMIGAFDKTVMHLGEEAMREEFIRILPAIKSGGYIPSVDHQTPPGVSLENYKIFMRLLRQYCSMV